MNIEINLYSDWIKLVLDKIESLKEQGFIFESFEDWKQKEIENFKKIRIELEKENKDISIIERQLTLDSLRSRYESNQIHTYLDFQYRLVKPKPREIVYSKEFICIEKLREGLKLLEYKIKNGISLFPHLSRQIFNATIQDGMLFDWGIHHFHLGTEPDTKRKGLIKGTKEIVYAIVKEEKIYFIIIDEHNRWARKDILLIVKKNFSHLIEQYKMEGILGLSQSYTEKEHEKLRRAGASLITEIDGEYYFSPGGGINTAGGSMTSITKIQQLIYWYEKAEEIIKEYTLKQIEPLVEQNIKLPEKIKYKMEELENVYTPLRN